LLWALLLFLMPLNDEPALNDVSELDNWRDFWGLVSLGLLLMILLPAPRGITLLFG
ncbi:MAG TPA: site-2 protease family protein, partial [Kamptonema sp.]|nr:site-2 protease family protein [Kamptonema sp.]